MKYVYVLISISCLLVSCHDDNYISKDRKDLLTTDSLTFFAGLPADMELYENKLFINDFYGENGLVKVVDIDNDSTLFSFIEKGVGPGEYISISNLNFFRHHDRDAIGIFDVSTKMYRAYYLDSVLLYKKEALPFYSKRSELPYAINQFFKINDGYMANGFLPDGKFALFDDSLTFIKYTGHYRSKPQANIPNLLHSQANLGKSRISSDQKHLVNIIFSAGVVEYYSIEQDSIEKKWEYVLHELDYKIKDGTSIKNNKVEGFISVDIANNYIYTLYSGTKYDPEAIANYGRYIYKFDLDGNLIDIFELDRDVLDIRVAGNKIYAIVLNPDPLIMIYEI